MEQAYRRLIDNLSKHRLIEEIADYNYHEIKIVWKSGVRERIVLPRVETSPHRKLSFYKSKRYYPVFAPKAMWWEDLSNDYYPKHNYLENINDLEHNVDNHVQFINWKWSDYKKSRFFEKLITVHEILDVIIKNGWSKENYPIQSLHEDLNFVLNDDLSKYKLKKLDFYCLRMHAQMRRPGEKILKHFFPMGDYARKNPSHLFNCKNVDDIRRVYKAMRMLINRNYRQKNNPKKLRDINYNNILKSMRYNKIQVSIYRSRQIGLYRRLIQDLGLNGKSFFDVDPLFGERALAAYVEECPYFYIPTCPFDICAPNLSKFINYDFNIADDRRYDFSMYDNELYNKNIFEKVLNIMSEKVDVGLIYVKNLYYDDFAKNNKPDKYFHMKTSRMFQYCGRWLLYYF